MHLVSKYAYNLTASSTKWEQSYTWDNHVKIEIEKLNIQWVALLKSTDWNILNN